MPNDDILISISEEPDATLRILGEYIGSAYSPQIDVTETQTGHEVAITYDDASTGITTKTFDVEDGHDGADGYSPTATVTQLADGATIRITDKDGTTTTTVSNGADGSDGADGFSPTVDVQPIEGGHEVTITDAQGPHSFDVMDGDPAEPGSITDAMLAPDGIKAQVAQLWGNQLKGSASGELMQASDAYGAPMLSLGVDGKSTQVTTTGAQMLNDATSTRGYKTNPNGNLVSGSVYSASDYIAVEASTTYRFANLIGSTYGYSVCEYDENKEFIQYQNIYGGTPVSGSFTMSGTTAYVRVSYSTSQAGVAMVSKGSAAVPYEPYTGGKPSPNPDYPQPIVSVEPRNILPNTVYHLAENGKVVEGSAYRSMYCEVDPNTTYTVSRARALGNRFGVYTTTVEPAAGVTLTTIKRPDTDTGILAYTFTTAADAAYAFFYLANNDADVSDSDMQLEKGSVAHPYLPYGCSLALAFAGKNLLQITTQGNNYYTVNSDGSITYAGDTTQHQIDVGTVKVYAGVTYHLSGCPAGGSTNTYRMYPAGKSGSWYDTGNGATFTPTADETLTIRVYVTSTSSQQYAGLVFKPQLEVGSTATEFKKYSCTTVPLYDGTLRSLPDGTKDTLALTYLRPSTHDGWAWYSRTLTALVGETTTAATDGVTGTVGVDVMSTTGEIADGPTVLYKLATPITTQLDPIELPVLPAPTCTVWADPTTGLQMSYVRDTNLVITAFEAALADLATS